MLLNIYLLATSMGFYSNSFPPKNYISKSPGIQRSRKNFHSKPPDIHHLHSAINILLHLVYWVSFHTSVIHPVVWCISKLQISVPFSMYMSSSHVYSSARMCISLTGIQYLLTVVPLAWNIQIMKCTHLKCTM